MNTFRFVSVCVFYAHLINGAPENLVKKFDEKLDYRLPTTIEPISYVISLTPHFDNKTGRDAFTFDGNVDIELRTNQTDIRTIVMHLNGLDILKSNFVLKNKWQSWLWVMPPLRISNTTTDSKTDKYTIELEDPMTPNQLYILSFQYSGKLQTDMHGFYRSSYEENGITKWLAATQMEPVHARKVFPCFDEPKFKATFVITISRPNHFQPTISNTQIETTKEIKELGLIQETFEKTPRMSTYLVAFIISEFKCRENENKTFSVCSRPNAFDQTKYSFDVGQPLLANFDKLFEYGYSSVPEMKKMTMVALPDFAAGAMENWGLLTFRETALLYDPLVSTALAQQRVASVVAHEQAHMWFGDLVTCDWWEHTWLNEGFARYFQYFGTAMIESEWGLEQQFIVEQLQNVFNRDSLDDTHALSHEINSPDDISDIFGTISYNKGSSIIRMIEHLMGHDKFISALRKYLNANEFQTSVPEKLYLALQGELSDSTNISHIMSSWINQIGYPLVEINVDNNRKQIQIKQKRFLMNNPNHNDQTQWEIPINYATNKENQHFNNTATKFILSATKNFTDNQITLNLGEEIDWIIFNVQQTGYYRVNYDNITWSRIDDVLYKSHSDIHVLNRAQIVDDSLNLARGNQLSYEQALHTIQYLKNETEYVPWYAAFSNFDFILNRFKNDESTIFKNHILSLVDHVYSHLGFKPNENDTRLDVYNRGIILKNACHLGHKQCIADAWNEFEKSKNENYTIPVNLVPVVYCTVIREGSNTEWELFWEKFKRENVAAEQVVILNALGCTKESQLVEKYLDLILTDNIRLQDKHSALISTLSQQQNIDIVLNYVLKYHENITTIFESKTEISKIFVQLAKRFTLAEQIAKVQQFMKENESIGASDQVLLAIKNAEFNLKWSEHNIPVIKKYLSPVPSAGHIFKISIMISMLLPIFTFIFI